MEETPPFPTPLTAVMLTLGSWLGVELLRVTLLPALGPVASLGVALALAVGGTATIAARNVPPPEAERIGLGGFRPALVLPLLLLVPLVLLTSELDNVLRAAVPPPEAVAAEIAEQREEARRALPTFELAVVMVGLAPVLQEFFFRGVVQQGLVQLGGPLRGVLGAAMLYSLGQASPTDPGTFLSSLLGSLVTGLVLGHVRLATRSVLAPILVSMAMAGAGLAALVYEVELPIPGFNGPAGHTPAVWLVPAALSVAAGVAWMERARRR